MTLADFCRSIRKAQAYIADMGEVRQVGPVSSLEVSTDIKRLALTPGVKYRDVYFAAMRESAFNVLLRDYSFFQYSYVNEYEIRCAFYPSPFTDAALKEVFEYEELIEQGVLEFEELSSQLDSAQIEVIRPLIRYEYSHSQYRRLLHPTSHLHIGMHGEDRWPVAKRLNPATFTLLIFRMYFSTAWAKGNLPLEENGYLNRFDWEYAQERRTLAATPDEKFCAEEKAHFHIL